MWNKIKKILSKQGGKCIIMEENQPAYLVMKLEDYEKMLDNSQTPEPEIEKANRDIAALEEGKQKNDEWAGSIEEEIKVEDLPF